LSLEALQLKLICEEDTGAAVKPVGVVGGVVSGRGGGGVVPPSDMKKKRLCEAEKAYTVSFSLR
jgi:hypothetical protein